MKPLVIGVGNRWRRDDGLGPRVVEQLERRLPPTVDLVALDGEPTRLVDTWEGRPWVLVIDAVRAGDPPGTVHRVDGLDVALAERSSPSSHGAGVATAVALGAALDRLPGGLVVLGVEPADVDHGDVLSPTVAAVFERVLDAAEQEVRAACA